MEHCADQQRAFYRRQAERLLELAAGCDPCTAQELLRAAQYYLDKLATPPEAVPVAV
jgi:G3E family GTPase